MVSKDYVHKQLKALDYKIHGWGKGEVKELERIILPDEEIHELVNGFYEGGFALLVATDIRVLLIDQKPLNYLTVEDLRFDMINEMDYNHRLLGARISIASGDKTLRFTSLNQPRLRKLINHVQHSMAESKKKVYSHQEGQNQHLEQINQQLQAYLVAQHQHQMQLQKIQEAQAAGQTPPPAPEPIKPSPELSDYLYSQSLLAQYQAQTGQTNPAVPVQQVAQTAAPAPPAQAPQTAIAAGSNTASTDELYAEGIKEIFGQHQIPAPPSIQQTQAQPQQPHPHNPLEINPMRIAYSKLPMALRNRKFSRPDSKPFPATE